MNHLQALFPMIKRVLEKAGITKNELEAVAVSIGPGSFTGIRIGMAAAKTLAQALDLPMAAVPTLKSFAYAEHLQQSPLLVCPMLDARRDQVYAAAYLLKDGNITEKIPPDAYDVRELLKAAAAAAGETPVRMYGDGTDAYAEAVAELTGVNVETAPEENRYQSAAYVLRAAEAGKLCSYNEVKPLYLRKSEAERKLEAGQLGRKKLKKAQPVTDDGMEIPPADEPVVYRQACNDDVKTFASLDSRCFSNPWSETSFEGELNGQKKAYYVAAENSKGSVIGFAGVVYIAGEGEVNRVAVHPLYRGRGIAGHMMDMLLADADEKDTASITLEVREANRSAISLYKNHGFSVEGKREGYYAHTGENALLMRRNRKDV
jgi:tRNA threonylcarbamoyl adenosine modification protein YeaZ/ribosomal-protein-alanine acetyltransferase